jgi:sporulation protein YqfC
VESVRHFGRRLRKFTADLLEVPKDVVMDLPRITWIGDMQLFVENHRGLLEFTGETLRLTVAQGELCVRGEGLVLRTIHAQEIVVEGRIQTLTYMD